MGIDDYTSYEDLQLSFGFNRVKLNDGSTLYYSEELDGRNFKPFGIIKDCNLKIIVRDEPETVNFVASIKDII